MSYINREDAGRRLARALWRFRGADDTVVLALPRGGVVLGAEVARALGVPLGLVLVRKIGHPSYAEYAIGAIAEDYEPVYNEGEAKTIGKDWLREAESEARELIRQRRDLYYGNDFQPPVVKHKTVILVDDGIATGLTMKAAVQATRNKQARHIIVAVPIASKGSLETMETIADKVVVLDNPEDFVGTVGGHYQEFEQVDDEEVRALLREVHKERSQS